MLGTIPSKAKRRFNLLLLEEKEYYFEDYGGFCHLPPTPTEQLVSMIHRKQWKGRLHIGSKSLFFDSDDSRNPILRFSYEKMTVVKLAVDKNRTTVQEYIQII